MGNRTYRILPMRITNGGMENDMENSGRYGNGSSRGSINYKNSGRSAPKRKTASRRRKNPAKIILFIFIVFIVILAAVYIYGAVYYKSHFLRGTIINGIDVSGMTLEELEDTIKGYDITVRERGAGEKEVYVEKISGNDIGIEIISGSGLEEIMEEQGVLKWFTKSGKTYSKDTLITYDKELLTQSIKELKGLNKEYATKPTNAKISEYNTQKGYEIIPETQGNFLDEDLTTEVLENAISDLKEEVDLDYEACYLTPKIDSGHKDLNNLLTAMNKMVKAEITYDFGGTKEVVDSKTISEWMVIDKYSVSIDRDKVEEYVATLRKKYDTIFRSRSFDTSYGKTVTIEKGDYGWWMNYVKETDELKAQIEEGKGGERTPVYYQTAAQYGAKDYGDTYVEINLTAQHLFVYKDGEKVMESDFVSGNTSRKMGTPAGVYGITYKERYGVLVGETYESTVAYWMPFNGDIGLHDAIWKTQFGSNFYQTDGSHGCINLPYLVAKQIYSLVEKGTPVICYKLKGTASDSVTVQSYEEIAKAAIEAIDAIGEVTKDSKEAIETARYMYNKVGGNAQPYVTNYKTLTDAEKEYKQLTEG